MEQNEGQRRTWTEEIELAGGQLFERIKELISEGNVRRIRVRSAEGTSPFLEIPITAGVVGGGLLLIAAPWLAALGALAAIVARFKVEVVREAPIDEVIDLTPDRDPPSAQPPH